MHMQPWIRARQQRQSMQPGVREGLRAWGLRFPQQLQLQSRLQKAPAAQPCLRAPLRRPLRKRDLHRPGHLLLRLR